jgi:hypothetical protein
MSSPQTSQLPDAVAVQPPVYPMLAKVVLYGDQATVVLVAAVIMWGAAWAWLTASPWPALTGLAAAAAVYVLTRIAVEMVRLVCDMLLPK